MPNGSQNPSQPLRLVEDVVDVCLESADENMTSAMALLANAVLDSLWNGWARPIATAPALSDFLDRWRRNDPNGTWGDVTTTDQQLIYMGSDADEPDVFPQAGMTHSGEPLYDLGA